MHRVFISHSKNDLKFVEAFVDDILVKGLELKAKDIFCTSMDGLGINSGADFVEKIKEKLSNCEVAILILSENYKASEVCLNEMGAAWILSKNTYPFVLEPLTFASVGVLHRNNQVSKLSSKSDLDNFKTEMEKKMSLESVSLARWNAVSDKFLKDISKIDFIHPKKKVDISELTKIESQRDDIQNSYNELFDEIEKLKKYIDDLEKIKDKVKVKEIKKKYQDEDIFEDFNEIIDNINKHIKTVKSTVTIKTLLAENYGVRPDLDYGAASGYRDEIDDAIRRKFLTREYDSTEKDPLPKIRSLLEDLVPLETEEFAEAYNEKFSATYDPSDQDFWNRHFDI